MRHLIAVVTLLAVVTAVAEPIVRPDDPRIADIAAVLPAKPGDQLSHVSNRVRWDALASSAEGKAAIAEAEKAQAEPIADLSDRVYLEYYQPGVHDDNHYGRNKGRRGRALSALVLGECLESRKRFLPKIVDYLESMCDETTWVNPGHNKDRGAFDGTAPQIDLGSMSTSQLLAQTLDLLDGALPEKTVARVKDCCEKRIFSLYRQAIDDPVKHERGCSWMRGTGNWNPACHHGVIVTALSLLDSREERARFMLTAAVGVDCYLRDTPSDGYCTEGTGYWNYGFGNCVKLGLLMRTASRGKVDVFGDPRMRQLGEYIYDFQVERFHTPQFTDGAWGGGANCGDPVVLALMRQAWPDLFDSSALSVPLLKGGLGGIRLRAFGQEPAAARPTRDVLPIRKAFDVSQVYILRKDPSAKGKPFGIGLKGGRNDECHNHNDIGSYSLFVDGYDMAGDPGCKSYTKDSFTAKRYEEEMRGSYGHPVPCPADCRQQAGRKHSAKVLSTRFSPQKDVVVLDLSGAYQDVPGMTKLVRTFTYDRTAGSITVRDDVEFSSPQPFETPIVTYSDMIYSYDPTRFVLVSPDRKRVVHVNLTVEGGAWDWKTKLIDNTPKVSPKRMAVRFKQPIKKASVAVSYQAKQ